MLPLKLRLKMLNKLAQAVPGSPASPASPSSPASPASPSSPSSPTSPTQPGSTTTAPLPPPPAFNPISGPWAWIPNGYNGSSVGELSAILNAINGALYFASSGKYSLQKNQSNLGGLDPSGGGSTDSKNLILLSQLLFRTFLNNGQPFKPTPAQIANWVTQAKNSQPLSQLSQLNPTGPAGEYLRLGSSFREFMNKHLDLLAGFNRAQQQQTR
jgi:hypothetical protein